jgi:hypothetical protein
MKRLTLVAVSAVAALALGAGVGSARAAEPRPAQAAGADEVKPVRGPSVKPVAGTPRDATPARKEEKKPRDGRILDLLWLLVGQPRR